MSQPLAVSGTFTAPAEGLRATARHLEGAARAARAVCEHPGRVRGLAEDGGDPELRDAASELARRWHWSLEQLAGSTSRWAALLDLAAEHYAEAERQASRALDRLGRLGLVGPRSSGGSTRWKGGPSGWSGGPPGWSVGPPGWSVGPPGWSGGPP